MDFHALLAKMQQIENSQPVQSEECGMMPPTSPTMAPPGIPPKPETPPPSMSVNLNAQGMDNIEQMMKLFQKVNPDMMPKVSPGPTVTTAPGITAIKSTPSPLKMLPDFDADNDDKIGGEMDMEIEPMDQPKDDMMSLDKDDEEGSQPGGLGASLDRDGDGDHDMDDHAMEPKDDEEEDDDEEKKEAWANEPNEEEKDIDYMVNKLAGGMNKSHGTYPKVSDGDNPMQKITRMGESDLQSQIRAELRKRLAEAKGAK
jgi:hypothetical protein